ncbi:MAG: hypothetical protein ABSC23_19660 [Bryobacteraceae bacterium]|jgi:hypothetical protein
MKRVPALHSLALTGVVLLSVGTFTPALAQFVVPAKSGMVDYVEGEASIDGQRIPTPLVADFPYVKQDQRLSTAEGRVEVLMNPGLFMRLGENGAFRMVNSDFDDTRVELESGSAVVQRAEVTKDNNFALAWKNSTAAIMKAGDYRFDTDPARIRVFSGLARVQVAGGDPVEITSGKMLLLDGNATVQKFDKDDTDALDRWSSRRGGLLAAANASAARDCSGFVSGYISRTGSSPCRGNWRWNPYYSLWTYIPFGRVTCDVWAGYCYYNPAAIWGDVYQPRIYNGGSNPSQGGGGGAAYPGAPGSATGVADRQTMSAPAMSSRGADTMPSGRMSGAPGAAAGGSAPPAAPAAPAAAPAGGRAQ